MGNGGEMSDEMLDYLEQLTLDELLVLDSACEKFKLSREGGVQEPPEAYLQDSSGIVRISMLIELLRTEIDLRFDAGESPTLEEYSARYPEHSPSLAKIFVEKQSDHSRKKEMLGSRNLLTSSEREGQLLVGTLLGHYRIEKVIGVGGMGLVLQARDTKLDREVAIKLPSRELLDNASVLKNFVREAKIAAATRHDNIVTIHSVEEDADGRPYLVMERVNGISLEEYVRKYGPMSPKQTVELGLQIANGLSAAHDRGLVHHDIKPSNFLLESVRHERMDPSEDPRTQSFRVKLTDFGLAQSMVSATFEASEKQEGMVIGTPLYMSPEQTSGLPTDARSDLFSLGSVLYFLCSGKPAFAAHRIENVLHNVRTSQPTPLSDWVDGIPSRLVSIIERLMSKEPEKRYSSAKEVALSFRDLQKHWASTEEMPHPRHLQSTTAVAIILVACLSLAVLYLSVRKDRLFTSGRTSSVPESRNDSSVSGTTVVTWTVPTKVQFVDSNSEGSNPSLTADGKRLFFVSRSRGPHRLYEAKRDSTDQPFGVAMPVLIPMPVGVGSEPTEILDAGTPCVSADGLRLAFYSLGFQGHGRADLWETKRTSFDAPWEPMQNLGKQINTSEHEFAPNLSSDGLTLFWFRAESDDNAEIWMATRKDVHEKFGDARKIMDGVNTPTNEQHPFLSNDGLTLYFDRGTPEPKLWQASRKDIHSEFSLATRTPLPFEWNDINAYAPTLSLDGSLMMFTSNRVPGKQGFDTGELWQTQRLQRAR